MKQEELIAIGHEAEIFLNTPLGKYMQERAHQEVSDAMEALAVVNPTDVKKITYLQNIVARYDKFSQWIKEAVAIGNNAYTEYVSEGE